MSASKLQYDVRKCIACIWNGATTFYWIRNCSRSVDISAWITRGCLDGLPPPPLKMAATLIAQFWGSKVIPRIAPLKGDDLCCQRLQHGLCVLVLCHVYIFEKYMAMSLILSVTIQVYRHSCSRCCLPSLRNHAKFPENSNFNRFWLNHPCVIQTDGRVIA